MLCFHLQWVELAGDLHAYNSVCFLFPFIMGSSSLDVFASGPCYKIHPILKIKDVQFDTQAELKQHTLSDPDLGSCGMS